MKILYLTSDISLLGGVEKVTLQKAVYFINKFGYDVTIISQNNRNKSYFFNIDKRIKIINLQIEAEKNFFKRQFQKIKYLVWLKKFLKKENYNVMITTGFFVDIFLIF